MGDSFDEFGKQDEKPPEPEPIRPWTEKLVEAVEGKWVSFEYEGYGMVHGELKDMKYIGLDNGIPDFELVVQGKNNLATVRMLDSRAQFHDSELCAIERKYENYE